MGGNQCCCGGIYCAPEWLKQWSMMKTMQQTVNTVQGAMQQM